MMTATYETTTRKNAYGVMATCYLDHPDLKTDVEAAKGLGIATIRFNHIARRHDIRPTTVAGTEKRKYPRMVFTPEQVARVAELAPLCDGNGHRKD